ncbi:YvzF family protein [Bacillus cytotoxicus]|uniref:YvzF family protein n=1 Tax=Bacillus cytotoxicus TaxID=580165 RepID=A0ACC6A792_9BACI|nr:YvzF family protein [Bacillus cytotoxicus]
MLNVRVSGNEEEVKIFLTFFSNIAEAQGGYKITRIREPQKGNNPKYKNSSNVLGYMSLVSIISGGENDA